jgi:hypothetical protein
VRANVGERGRRWEQGKQGRADARPHAPTDEGRHERQPEALHQRLHQRLVQPLIRRREDAGGGASVSRGCREEGTGLGVGEGEGGVGDGVREEEEGMTEVDGRTVTRSVARWLDAVLHKVACDASQWRRRRRRERRGRRGRRKPWLRLTVRRVGIGRRLQAQSAGNGRLSRVAGPSVLRGRGLLVLRCLENTDSASYYSQLHLSYSWQFLKFFVPELGKLGALYGRGGGLGGQDRPRRLEPYGILGAQGITITSARASQ